MNELHGPDGLIELLKVLLWIVCITIEGPESLFKG